MNLNYEELQILYYAVKEYRDAAEEDLYSIPANDPERNSLLEEFKNCNSLLRKVKKFMAENQVKPLI